MKYMVISFLLVFAAVTVHAQTLQPLLHAPTMQLLPHAYKQKQLNDTLQMLFPDLQTSVISPSQNNMPVLPLKNEGVKVGSNNLGEVYSMEVDQMPRLKPFKNKDEVPDAIKPKEKK